MGHGFRCRTSWSAISWLGAMATPWWSRECSIAACSPAIESPPTTASRSTSMPITSGRWQPTSTSPEGFRGEHSIRRLCPSHSTPRGGSVGGSRSRPITEVEVSCPSIRTFSVSSSVTGTSAPGRWASLRSTTESSPWSKSGSRRALRCVLTCSPRSPRGTAWSARRTGRTPSLKHCATSGFTVVDRGRSSFPRCISDPVKKTDAPCSPD
jgi:hypothetical protein